VHHEIIEASKADAEKQEIGEQCLDHDRRRQRLRSAQECDHRDNETNDQEGEPEV
jgi:hypothetical protein